MSPVDIGFLSNVLLCRHGQTEWNVAGRRQGHLDSPLTPTGLDNARQIAAAASGRGIDSIFTSPLGRARTTASIVGDHLGLEPVIVEGFHEVHLGDWAGLTSADIESRFPGALAERDADKYEWQIPGGESYADAEPRVADALAAIELGGSTLPLIVAHEMVARVVTRRLIGLSPEAALRRRFHHGGLWHLRPGDRTIELLA